MAATTIAAAIERIKDASEDSPIDVFALPDAGIAIASARRVMTTFASTLETQRRISLGDPAYIGTFDRTSDPALTQRIILDGVMRYTRRRAA